MNPINRGKFYSRTKDNPREKAFADEWEKENEPNPGVNYGTGLLQDLFVTGDIFLPRAEKELTVDERMVAATAIQWLGSNCGWGFLERALKRAGWKLQKGTATP